MLKSNLFFTIIVDDIFIYVDYKVYWFVDDIFIYMDRYG